MISKIRKIIVVLAISFMVSGCGSGNQYVTDYNIGLIYTTQYQNKSQIRCLNKNMEEVNVLTYRYSSMSYDGFKNSVILDDKLYLLPLGNALKLDYGKVAELNLENGEIQEYDFDRINITDFNCTSKYICVSSNLNGENYVERYNKETNKIETMMLKDVMVHNLTLKDDRIFATLLDLETDICFLCEFDMQKQDYQVLYEMEIGEDGEEPEFMEMYQDNLYFVQEDILYEYNIESGNINQIKLPHTKAYNLKLIEDKLYIGCTDIFNAVESHVDILDLSTKKVIKSVKCDGIILQMEVSKDGILYVLDYDKLSLYDISKDKTALIDSKIIIPTGNYYLGGFYLNE